MPIDYDKMLGAAPKGLNEIPRQEIYLEVDTDGEARKKIYLEDIANLPESSIKGFRQYISGQLAALSAAQDVYWEEPGRDRSNRSDFANYKKLSFKRKIHAVFARELDLEVFFRRETKLLNLLGGPAG